MNESTLSQLYDSTVIAFPKTELRQHATNSIIIKNLQWIPFLGTKTLFVKGLAQNEGKEYNPIILFKGLDFQNNESTVNIWGSDGLPYKFKKLSLTENDVVLRCNCKDWKFRLSYYNYLDHSLYGRKPKKYMRVEGSTKPPANPLRLPGMCKHILKLVEVLEKANLFIR